MKKVALIGYSGHAYVVADILLDMGYSIVGYFEKQEAKSNPYNIQYLGFDKEIDFSEYLKNDIYIFPAIGDNKIRQKVISFFRANSFPMINAISPSANISSNVTIGSGSLVCQGACINPFAKIADGVIINTGAIIEHECEVESYAHIAPGAVLAGNVRVGKGSFIGANSFVKQGIFIGNNVIIGAGSVIINNISENEVWVGNPAKKIKENDK
ncbi:MAG: acetyltransferase [Bacteroidota bacterium]